MVRQCSILAAVALLFPAAVWAQAEQAPGASTLRLSDAEKADLLSHDTEASVDAAQRGLGGGPAPDGIHGEIGALVGSRGTRATYGSVAIPLGPNSEAKVSFEAARTDGPR